MAKMPPQKPGKSEQSVQTPKDFMDAVKAKFGQPKFDLAADAQNTQAKHYISEEDNSLIQNWDGFLEPGLMWLNPPYSKIGPWVKKASESKGNILVLVPASVGSNWWRDYVHYKCSVWFLNGRLTFVGHDKPYPKDLVLLEYNGPYEFGYEPWYEVWSWRNS